MPNTSSTSVVALSWSWSLTMSTPSFTSTPSPRQWSSARTNVQLHTTPAVPSRPLAAVGRRIDRICCSATYTLAPRPEPTATAVAGELRRAQDAAVLGIGTANPASCMAQEEYADWYFRVTKRDHLTKLKAKMKKICHNSGIKKRYFHHTEDTLLAHPEFLDRAVPSLDARQSLLASAVPELAAAAAARAIAEWGRPAADISHLVFTTNSGAHMPGADLRLASLLGLRPSVQRTMMYLTGCHAGSAALRVAKDVAENNRGARVLVACGDLSLAMFRAPHEDHPETLVLQALFGDGAGAVVVGAGCGGDDDLNAKGERSGFGAGIEYPLFEMVSASQTVVLSAEDAIAGQLGDGGLVFSPSAKMPALVREHIEQCLADAVGPLGLPGTWNDLFWAVHPGGPAILDSVQAALALAPGKLAASRYVLREYGNMSGASVIFVLDELRRRRHGDLHGDFGVMLGLGPGLTVETMVLRSRSATGATKKFF